ncbi:hypothetical protein O4H49_08545 [Kiloniella laminariae]|uniref:Uncharacterized protein n=1 Tax=Kiloniella laminariae TaxID=454162 RepID=A0ABT4LIA7_9PROT|nr:hypothetical protein [Kiloniella laminariae]MCZ4280821.1 hypothetical protein [Kiloniella laminariae]
MANFNMTRLLKAVDRLTNAIETLDTRLEARLRDSAKSYGVMETQLKQSRDENAELTKLKQEVGDRLDTVIGQLAAALEK